MNISTAFAFFLITILFYQNLGCLIVNCPRGGKRNHIPSCPKCGPDHLGQCISQGICCGPMLGCLLNPDECQSKELDGCLNIFSQSCSETGRCINKGLCCDQESCRFDETCFDIERNYDKSIDKDIYMNKILKTLEMNEKL